MTCVQYKSAFITFHAQRRAQERLGWNLDRIKENYRKAKKLGVKMHSPAPDRELLLHDGVVFIRQKSMNSIVSIYKI